MGKGLPNYSADFTANLTFTISNVINLHQVRIPLLKGWYNKDDVAAEWKKVRETTFLHFIDRFSFSFGMLCFDSASNILVAMLCCNISQVLKAVMHGDSVLFANHLELTNAG
ncbi:hypothetical protein Golob_011042 [Gossypium lobatum]|uniref:Staygreen protein domain-containing protein n=1 Tax=Gossypium lobatum TaxID=34289 RepID=A0A7J8MN81_9ROSI|nr:hypothetical protein [Gossypium lobatum]